VAAETPALQSAPREPFLPASRPADPTPSPAPAFVAPAFERPARKESIQELVAFGLAMAGAGIGIASLFLPWANEQGIGIGNYSIGAPPPNQWGWGMPSAAPFFLLSLLVLGAASGSDLSQAKIPHLAAPIRQVTDVVLPMILGGIYLGVFLLYLTLPGGHAYGSGTVVLFVAGCLLIAGAVTALFFPAKPDDADSATAGKV
jgi:hypothetical protein